MTTQCTRCVHIFPRFNTKKIDHIREKYDTLYHCIEPHITLVFPFESKLTKSELMTDLKKQLKDVKPFRLSTKDIKAVNNHGFYLFLEIQKGGDILSKLHYQLHQGLLKPYQSPWTKDGSYEPHITLGRFESQEEMQKAFDEVKEMEMVFETMVDQVYVEIIGEHEESIIEGSIKLVKERSKQCRKELYETNNTK